MSDAVKTIPAAAIETVPPLPLRRFTVEQYHRMIATGVLTENDRVELLEGWIVNKMPQNPVHAGTISIVAAKLSVKLPKGWIIRVQSPITLPDSEPEPDLAVVRGPEGRYLTTHPQPAEICLLVEVADTTLDYDRAAKGRAFAQARIPVYWIVNLMESKVEVYSQRRGGKTPCYRRQEHFGIEYGVPLVIAGRELAGIPVRHLFP